MGKAALEKVPISKTKKIQDSRTSYLKGVALGRMLNLQRKASFSSLPSVKGGTRDNANFINQPVNKSESSGITEPPFKNIRDIKRIYDVTNPPFKAPSNKRESAGITEPPFKEIRDIKRIYDVTNPPFKTATSQNRIEREVFYMLR